MAGENHTGPFGVLGWLVSRSSVVVVVFWVAVALLAYLYLPPLDDRVTGDLSDLVAEPEDFVSGSAGNLPSGGGGAGTAPDAVPSDPTLPNDGSGGSSPSDDPTSGNVPVAPSVSGASENGGVPTGDPSAGDGMLSGVVEAPAMLVFSDPAGLDAGDFAEIRERLGRFEGAERPYRLVSAVPMPLGGLEAAGDGATAGRQTSLPVLLFFEPGISPTGIGTGTTKARELASEGGGSSDGSSITVTSTGTAPAQNDSADAIEESLPVVTVATLSAIFLILAFTYRSVVTPFIPLASVGLSAFLTLRLIAYLAAVFGVRIPSQVEPVILVLLFGVGTDYALFLLSRTRRSLAAGNTRLDAAQEGLARTGPVVLSSAAVLVAAFMVLSGAELEVYRALGPGLALALCVVTLVTVTLVPALLAISGRLAFGGSLTRLRRNEVRTRRRDEPHNGVEVPSTRRAGLLERRPALVAGVILSALAVASLGVLGLRVGFDQVGALPEDAPSALGYEALSDSAPAGILSPVNVIVGGDGLASLSPDERSYRLERLQSEIWATGGYAAVVGPGDSGLLPGVEFLAEGGSSARFVLVSYDSPYSPTSLDQIRDLRERMPEILDRSGLDGLEVRYGGQAVLAAEARTVSDTDLERLAPLVFGVAFVVLALLLRTPVAPVYLLLSTALGFAATLGVATVFFQGILGEAGVVYYVPFALFLLLVALGSDYNIFIMSAIREEARRKPLKEAVADALSDTGRTISAAGLALSASFALLALIPLQDFRQIGLTVAAGILLDTFVIRPLLVPALVLILGKPGFWPAKVRDE
ncbi:MAG: MMPL family transporter [Rubrobacter sp.]